MTWCSQAVQHVLHPQRWRCTDAFYPLPLTHAADPLPFTHCTLYSPFRLVAHIFLLWIPDVVSLPRCIHINAIIFGTRDVVQTDSIGFFVVCGVWCVVCGVWCVVCRPSLPCRASTPFCLKASATGVARQSHIINQIGATPGFEMCFTVQRIPAPLGPRFPAKTLNRAMFSCVVGWPSMGQGILGLYI